MIDEYEHYMTTTDTPETPVVTTPCSRHVTWTNYLPLSPTDIPQFNGVALTLNRTPDPETDPDFTVTNTDPIQRTNMI